MTWTVAGVNFDHVHHMRSLLGKADDHPDVEIIGLCDERPEDPARGVTDVVEELALADVGVYDEPDACLDAEEPDAVITCPAAAEHGDWIERLAPHEVHVVLEKPMAASLAEADRIVDAMAGRDRELLINWPLAWYPPHRTTKRLIDEGVIGDVTEVHFNDGYTGPDRDTWFHDPERGGGSLHDYLGYGVTLGTWFHGGDLPAEVTALRHVPEDAAVDTRSVTLARYEGGISTFRTDWEPLTDPWASQPRPACGFVVVGTDGSIASYDYDDVVRVRTRDDPEGREVPVDDLAAPLTGPIEYLVHRMEADEPEPFAPVDPAFCREAQRIIESAERSASRGETVPLVDR